MAYQVQIFCVIKCIEASEATLTTHRPHSLRARSHDPILRIRFLVPRIQRPVQTVRFLKIPFLWWECRKVICSVFTWSDFQDWRRIFNLTPQWSQGYHAKFVGTFHLSRRVSDKNRACSISIRFFKLGPRSKVLNISVNNTEHLLSTKFKAFDHLVEPLKFDHDQTFHWTNVERHKISFCFSRCWVLFNAFDQSLNICSVRVCTVSDC